jgi:hypothetical protein
MMRNKGGTQIQCVDKMQGFWLLQRVVHTVNSEI